ncbi:MAG: extracellular solute-binding protein [Oscillospiraceae bacterium]|nr:extracellular solute-binding protein [Oscillospiraceae bacterium]
MKNIKIKKIIALIMIMIFICSVLINIAACGGNNNTADDKNNNNEDKAGDENENINADDEKSEGENPEPDDIPEEIQELKDNIPELNFDGYNYKILNTNQDDLYYMNLIMEPLVFESSGDIIEDAAYRRSIEIQERFNCKIEEIIAPNGSRGSMFRKSALAGDNAYDIACISPGEALSAASDKLIYDINELAYVNLDAPWWDQNARSSLSLLNKVYFCPGAYEVSNFDMTRILLFNKKLMQDYGITDDVYQLVKDGKWTFEKFFNMAKLVSEDVNGDGKYDKDDKFGVGSTADHVVFGSFMMASGEMTVRKDADDMPYFAAGSEHFNSVLISMVDNFYAGNFYFYPKNVTGSEDWCTDMFNEDRVLFYNITFNRIPKFRNMDADFGILPAPKFDEAQDKYYCESGSGMLAVIPHSAEKPDNNGAFLEAYAYYGYKYVVPQYKEVSLKTKMARDDDSAEMVDIIDVSRVYDLGRLYWATNAYDPYVTLFGAKKTDVASVTEKNAPKVETAIAKSLEKLFN